MSSPQFSPQGLEDLAARPYFTGEHILFSVPSDQIFPPAHPSSPQGLLAG